MKKIMLMILAVLIIACGIVYGQQGNRGTDYGKSAYAASDPDLNKAIEHMENFKGPIYYSYHPKTDVYSVLVGQTTYVIPARIFKRYLSRPNVHKMAGPPVIVLSGSEPAAPPVSQGGGGTTPAPQRYQHTEYYELQDLLSSFSRHKTQRQQSPREQYQDYSSAQDDYQGQPISSYYGPGIIYGTNGYYTCGCGSSHRNGYNCNNRNRYSNKHNSNQGYHHSNSNRNNRPNRFNKPARPNSGRSRVNSGSTRTPPRIRSKPAGIPGSSRAKRSRPSSNTGIGRKKK
jgi:hypothetical protein